MYRPALVGAFAATAPGCGCAPWPGRSWLRLRQACRGACALWVFCPPWPLWPHGGRPSQRSAVLRAFTRVDGGGVTGDMTYHHSCQVLADQGFMRFGGQAHLGELGKGAAKRGLAGQRAMGFKAEQAYQHGIDCQAAAQLRGLLKPQHSLGNKCLGQCQAAALWRAHAFACIAHQAGVCQAQGFAAHCPGAHARGALGCHRLTAAAALPPRSASATFATAANASQDDSALAHASAERWSADGTMPA